MMWVMLAIEKQKDGKSQVEVEKENIPSPVAPSSKIDPSLKELILPSKYFAHKIGQEDVPEIQEPNTNRIYIPPEEIIPAKAPAETNKYKILEEKEERISKFLLKGEKEHVVTFESTEHSSLVTPISKLVEDALSLVQKLNLPMPMGEIKYVNPGMIKYEAIDEFGKINTYLASPDFVLEKDATKSIPKALTQQLETLHKEIENLKNEVSTYNLDEVDAKIDELYELRNEIEERAKPRKEDQIVYILEFDSKDDEREYREVGKKIQALRDVRSTFQEVRKLEREAENLSEDITSLESYHGYLKEGDKIDATLLDPENNVSIYDKEGVKIIERAHSTRKSTDPQLGDLSSYYLLDLRGEIETKDYFVSVDPYNKVEREYIRNGDEVYIEERYDRKEGLKERLLNDLGIVETYNQGELVDKKVTNGNRFFHNIEVLKDAEGFDQMLLSASQAFPEVFLRNCYKVSNSDILNLAEKAISTMVYKEIKEASEFLQLEILKLENEESPVDSQVKILKEISDRLDFRIKMIEEGRELTRYDIKEDDARTASIWNDPGSRPYFDINDEWIDWEKSPAKDLISSSDIELSKKDMKLLISRFIYDKNLPTNQDSVNIALSEIATLREEYKSLDPFEKRNIVFATHSDTLIDFLSHDKYHYLETSKDHHQFGKASLLKDLRAKIGPEGDLKLLRTELDDLPSTEKIREILLQAEVPKEATENILKVLEDTKLPYDQQLSLIHLTKVIKEQGFGKNMSKVVELVRGTETERIENLKQLKRNIIEAIENTPPPFTFIFEGHGGPDDLYLSDGYIGNNKMPVEHEDTIKLSSEEIAKAFQKRHENFGAQEKENKDILIFQDCYNSNFIGRLSALLPKENMPVIFGSSEFNQYSLFNLGDEYGSPFLSDVMGIRDGLKSHMDDIFKRQLNNQVIELKDGEEIFKYDINTNPGIYVPDKEGNLIQVSQNLIGDKIEKVS